VSENMTLVCLACQVPDPPPEMTCTLGRDHRVGVASGCPAVAGCLLRVPSPGTRYALAPMRRGEEILPSAP